MDRNGASPAKQRPKHRFLRTVEFCCWFAGVFAILFVALSTWESYRFQVTQAHRLEQLEAEEARHPSLQTPEPPAYEPQSQSQEGGLVGKISIPRIGMSAIIAEGVDPATLVRAVGHFPGTATPDMSGTVVLAAHRDTFFRPLEKIQIGDSIVLDAQSGEYRYRVVRKFVVGPRDVGVLRSSAQSDLTLVTCFPFHYIGPAPKRFIVQAQRVSAPREPALPVETASARPESGGQPGSLGPPSGGQAAPVTAANYPERYSLREAASRIFLVASTMKWDVRRLESRLLTFILDGDC